MNQSSKTNVLILLGAGKPYQGKIHSGLNQTPDQRLILDWVIDAFSQIEVEICFVGGYNMEKIQAQYPTLRYFVNDNWQKTGSAESFFCSRIEPNKTYFISYTDVVYSKEIVRKLTEKEGEVVLVSDGKWLDRYQGRPNSDIKIAEKLSIQDGTVFEMGAGLDFSKTNAEFCGLLKMSKSAISKVLEYKNTEREHFKNLSLLDLVIKLKLDGFDIQSVDTNGNWAELNFPQDLARYILGTKSETLERLRTVAKKSFIEKQICFTVGDWNKIKENLISQIQKKFRDSLLAVRSSALAEDSWTTANAGVFRSFINVPSTDTESLVKSINKVSESYDGNQENQIFIQRMVSEPSISGVAFTRTMRTGAPYYVINYDEESGRTDTVTSGFGKNLKTLIVYRDTKKTALSAKPIFKKLLSALKELEVLVNYDALDVEFAISLDGRINIMQLRPIAIDFKKKFYTSKNLTPLLEDAQKKFIVLQKAANGILGSKTIFGVMPDWNPAEIIGTSPRALSLSLYEYLITDEVWAMQREQVGNRTLADKKLLSVFMGRPYVDVRKSLNSFIPSNLRPATSEKLVNYYLEILETKPHLHDKIEFEVIFSSITFNSNTISNVLTKAGFLSSEINQFIEGLTQITRRSIKTTEKQFRELKKLEKNRKKILGSDSHILDKAKLLLEDCKKRGTLPFAHLARSAFVATNMLKSCVQEGLIGEGEYRNFMGSLETVAEQLVKDTRKVVDKQITTDEFLNIYGHLRPGTYEITSLTYSEDFERLFPQKPFKSKGGSRKKSFSWRLSSRNKISRVLKESGLNITFGQFDRFLREAIEGREYSKFIFSRNLSLALDLIAEYGKSLGLDKEFLSYIPVGTLFELAKKSDLNELINVLSKIYSANKAENEIARLIELPPLLVSDSDFFSFTYMENHPNFVTQEKVLGLVVELSSQSKDEIEIDGLIVMIPRADPGYDWLFSRGISGFITKFGGVNSHMAIRAAEFGLPAVIGVGDRLYNLYRKANVIELDCEARQVRVLS